MEASLSRPIHIDGVNLRRARRAPAHGDGGGLREWAGFMLACAFIAVFVVGM
jgi:hypothetical protein